MLRRRAVAPGSCCATCPTLRPIQRPIRPHRIPDLSRRDRLVWRHGTDSRACCRSPTLASIWCIVTAAAHSDRPPRSSVRPHITYANLDGQIKRSTMANRMHGWLAALQSRPTRFGSRPASMRFRTVSRTNSIDQGRVTSKRRLNYSPARSVPVGSCSPAPSVELRAKPANGHWILRRSHHTIRRVRSTRFGRAARCSEGLRAQDARARLADRRRPGHYRGLRRLGGGACRLTFIGILQPAFYYNDTKAAIKAAGSTVVVLLTFSQFYTMELVLGHLPRAASRCAR